VESFCNLTLTETTATNVALRYANADQINYTNDNTVAQNTGLHQPGNGTAEANPPELGFGGNPPFAAPYAQGDSWYLTGGYTNPVLGSFQFAAGIMHETGHNLGLKHGHVTQAGHGVTFPALPADHDSYEYSVMTYRQFPGDNPGNGDNAPDHPTTFMQNDIAALQYLYGANYGASANNGNTTYTWSTATGQCFIDSVGQGAPWRNYVLMTLWDGGGTDTYDFSNYTTNLSVDLNPGQWVVLDTSAAMFQRADLGNDGAGGAQYFARGNIANALLDPNDPTETASLIENANGGSGNDAMIGNDAGNTFKGGGGNDSMNGGNGTDTAVFTGNRTQYLSTLFLGSLIVADQRLGTPDGTDLLANFELFQFADGTFNQIEVLNQAPVLSPDPGSPHALTEIPGTTGSATPDQASGTMTFTDANVGDTHTVSASLSSATWSGGIVVVSETLTVVYDITVFDHHVGSSVSDSSTQPVTIIFTGTNDAPIAIADSNGTAKKSTLTVSADDGLLANDTDPDIHDQDDLFVSEVNGSAANVGDEIAGTYGTVTINADGSYVYVAKQGGLPPKIVAQDTFTYTLADGNGGTEISTLSIVVFNPGVHYHAGINTTLNGGNGPDVLDGSFGNDVLLGGNGPDVLIAGDGNTMTGGNGPDIILVRPDFGANTVTDFDVRIDAIQFDQSIFTDEDDVFDHTVDTPGGAVITDDDGNSLTLAGVTLAQLEQSELYLV
jgi:VCBS repeat-containing protein